MIYFDNASTTKMDKEVIEIMSEAFNNYWGNPSSLHKLGFEAEKMLEKSRLTIANKMNINNKNLFFTPSATIANNAVLNSYDYEGKNILISKIEHSGIYQSSLHKKAEIREVDIDEFGFIREKDLLDKIDENTVLVSIIHVNNELGSINNINKLAKIAKEKNSNLLFHSDGVQAFNKIDVNLQNIDFYTISSHKIHGPKGIAGLYIKNPSNFNPLYFGGGQEKGIFSSTENLPAIMGFSKAVELDNKKEYIEEINQYLRNHIEKINGTKIISPKTNVSPYILSICFENIGAEILLHYLEMDDTYISTGSACNKNEKSRVIEAIKVDEKYKNGCIRISLSKNSTMEEAKIFVDKLNEKIEMIRGIIG